MACNASKVPLLRAITKRGYAALANARPLGQTADVQCQTLGNKVVVASAESVLPITRVSVVFRAGSRNETYETLGAANIMRLSTNLSTINSSAFAIQRNIQQAGGSLVAVADRECVTYTVQATANHVDVALRYLQDAIQPAFKPWELADNVHVLRAQFAVVPNSEKAFELLHKAAFRTGLGNSIYIPKYQVGNVSSESLLHYYAQNCTASRCAVVGVGIDQNTLSGFAQSLELNSGAGNTAASKYHGGDARKDTKGNMTWVAIAGQGGAWSNQKESLAFAVLKKAVGGKASTKRGCGNGSLSKAMKAVAGDGAMALSAINISYADNGLFGFQVAGNAQNIGKAIEAGVKALKSAAVSADDVNRGKALLKAKILESYGTDGKLIHKLAQQAGLSGQVMSANALVSAIDSVTAQDVQAAAKKAGSSKLSIGAVGNLANVPFASDLA